MLVFRVFGQKNVACMTCSFYFPKPRFTPSVQLDQANLYAQYRPAKVREGTDHPDAIVESQVGASTE